MCVCLLDYDVKCISEHISQEILLSEVLYVKSGSPYEMGSFIGEIFFFLYISKIFRVAVRTEALFMAPK